MGDGAGGLALLVLVVQAIMLAGMPLLLGFGARLYAKSRDASSLGRHGAVAGGAVAGLLLGIVAFTYVFRPTTWDPPPLLIIRAEAKTLPPLILVVEDEMSGRDITWTRSWSPFEPARATVHVPSSGIVRVQAIDDLFAGATGSATMVWPDGSQAGANATSTGDGKTSPGYMAFWHNGVTAPLDRDPTFDDDRLRAYIRQREDIP